MLLTRDSGRSWHDHFESQLRPLGIAPWLARAVDLNTCWVIGQLSGSDVYCCYTRDAGRNWHVQDLPPNFFPNAVSFAEAGRGWIVGDDGDYFSRARKMLLTNDGGNFWEEIELELEGRPSLVHFLADGRHGWLIENRLTPDGEEISSCLHSSADGGRRWQQVSLFGREIGDLCVLDAETLFVAGADGFVSVTSDGGRNWIRSNTRCRGFINSLCFHDRNQGLALSDFGTLLLTEDGAKTWQKVGGLKRVGNLVAAYFLSDTRAIIVSSLGIHLLELSRGSAL